MKQHIPFRRIFEDRNRAKERKEAAAYKALEKLKHINGTNGVNTHEIIRLEENVEDPKHP